MSSPPRPTPTTGAVSTTTQSTSMTSPCSHLVRFTCSSCKTKATRSGTRSKAYSYIQQEEYRHFGKFVVLGEDARRSPTMQEGHVDRDRELCDEQGAGVLTLV